MKTISIANQKGGVGKTTSAINIAAGLAVKGARTLLIDLDMQRNTTMSFFDLTQITTTLADVLIGAKDRKPISEALYNTDIENLDLIPASIQLGKLDRFSQFEEQYRLKDSLETLADYEFAIIDCPPSLGSALTQAILASDFVLIPIKADYFALEGVIDLMDTITSVKRANPNLDVLGAFVTDFDQRINICGQTLAQAQEWFKDKLFDTPIRRNAKLTTAPALRQTIYEHAPNSYGSEDYLNLIDEMLDRLNGSTGLRLVDLKDNLKKSSSASSSGSSRRQKAINE
jgi:chromosome partitioning protein